MQFSIDLAALTLLKIYVKRCIESHCAKMKIIKEKPSKFQFHFPVLLVPCPMKKKLSKKTFVFGLRR